jgi:DNA replication protein DnaC
VLTNPTLDNLSRLKLGGMARALLEQREQPTYNTLSFEERLGLLIDRELQDRDNRRLDRHLKAAKLRSSACVQDIDFHHPRGLDRAQLLQLASSRWVEGHQQVLIVGPTGAGKTYIACALGHAAICQGHTALYLRVPRMLADLITARADGRFPRLIAALARVDVLILDLSRHRNYPDTHRLVPCRSSSGRASWVHGHLSHRDNYRLSRNASRLSGAW